METITLFILRNCPYCIRMLRKIETLLATYPAWREVPLHIVDEKQDPAMARQFDYYYVPALYLGEKKVYEEGVLHADLASIFRQAAKANQPARLRRSAG